MVILVTQLKITTLIISHELFRILYLNFINRYMLLYTMFQQNVDNLFGKWGFEAIVKCHFE